MGNELDQIMASCQEAYEQAEGRNDPPQGDDTYSVIIKSVKDRSFTQDGAEFAVVTPVYEILDGPHQGWILDGDQGTMGPASDNRVQMGLTAIKLLAKLLNGGKPFPSITDAVAIIKASAGAQLMVEVTHGVAKKSGKPYANVRPKELLSAA